jgi:choline dehydrogenase-like flavoprotein
MHADLDRESASSALLGRFDVCIFGSGPAGMTTAVELARKGKRVALVEAGGFEFSERSQNHYAGTESGIQNWNAIRFKRLRYFGGTSGHWAGRCGVFDEVDFSANPYHGMTGWPIGRRDVVEHQAQAADILDLGKQLLETRPLRSTGRESAFTHAAVALSPPTRFGQKYRREVQESSNLQLFTNASLTDLVPGPARPGGVPTAIDHAVVRNYAGRTFKIAARHYVLALGAVENARALLNSDGAFKTGIGNQFGWVGRCFMEHLNVEFGRFVVRDPVIFAKGSIEVAPTPALLSAERIGNGVLNADSTYQPEDYGRLKDVKHALRAGACKFETVREFARKFGDFSCVGEGVITSLLEQAPNRDSRVTLTNAVDGFGLRRANLHWQINDADRRTVRTLGMAFAADMARLDWARVKLHDYILNPKLEIPVGDHAHHMGTTRMSREAKDGVVDANCRVHSLDNLFVAGSSVFPTGGGTSPTLTIVTLALRLARHVSTLVP